MVGFKKVKKVDNILYSCTWDHFELKLGLGTAGYNWAQLNTIATCIVALVSNLKIFLDTTCGKLIAFGLQRSPSLVCLKKRPVHEWSIFLISLKRQCFTLLVSLTTLIYVENCPGIAVMEQLLEITVLCCSCDWFSVFTLKGWYFLLTLLKT